MIYGHHHKTGLAAELRVKPEHLDRKGDFVGNALAGGLGLAPKLEIFPAIVSFLAIPVVNVFGRQKLPPKPLLHQIAMFQYFASLPIWMQIGRKFYHHIAAFYAAALATLIEWAWSPLRSELRSASGAAKFLLSIECATRTPLYRHRFPALDAIHAPFFVRQFTSLAAAFCGAVKRVTAMTLSIAAQFARSAHKGLATYFAGKGDPIDLLCAAVMRVIAGLGTEFSHLAPIAWFRNVGAAMQALFHLLTSMVDVHKYQNHFGWQIARGEA